MENNYSIKIISFDVFDTCLARTYEKPTDLFIEVAEKIYHDTIPTEKKQKLIKNFFKQRIIAEKTCNKTHGRKKSCHFDQIYKTIKISDGCGFNKNEIAAIELQLEIENIYPIKKTLDLVNKYRLDGHQIIFISDMYLDKEFIQNLLMQHGFFQKSDQLYVSSENTLTKKSGSLFKHVLSKEGVLPHELLHHGDDLIADIRVPRSMGIRTTHITDTHCWPSEILIQHNIPIIPAIEASKINGFLKLLRQTEFPQHRKAQMEIIQLVTLFITTFTLWVFNKATEKKIDTLYFLAKDNDITYKIAKKLNKLYPSITVKYLYGSRRAWLSPSIELSDGYWKKLALPDGYPSSIIDALQRLNFTQEEIDEIKNNLKPKAFDFFEKFKANSCASFLDQLFGNPDNKKILLNKIDASRRTCIDYLQQEGLFNDSSWAIVDTGWQLNCQAALKRIMNSKKNEQKIIGFYLGISNSHLSKDIAGEAYSFTEIGSIFSKRPVVVEHVFFPSTHPSTISYFSKNGKISPLFSPSFKSESEILYTNQVHRHAIAFIEYLYKNGISPHFLTHNQASIIRRTSSFLTNPDHILLSELREICASEDARHRKDTLMPIFKKLTLFNVFESIAFCIKERSIKIRFTWIEASLADTNIIFRILLKIIFLFKKESKFEPDIEYKNKDI